MIKVQVDYTLKQQLDRENRVDPVLQEQFKEGDWIAQCPRCKSWMLAESWRDLNNTCACSYRHDVGQPPEVRLRPPAPPTQPVVRTGARVALALAVVVAIIVGGLIYQRNAVCAQERSQLQNLLAAEDLFGLAGRRGTFKCAGLAQELETAISTVESNRRQRLAQQETAAYQAAGDDLVLLRNYANNCTICTHKDAALNRIRELENPTITFRIKSNHPGPIEFAFYSATNKPRTWRGGTLRNRETQTHRLGCIRGELICYGAWVEGGPFTPYWGVGPGGRDWASANQCFTCPTAVTDLIVLETRDAKRPNPSITWRIKKEFSGSLALVFHYTSQPGKKSPEGSNMVYVIEDQLEHSYTLPCRSGEPICYGAWIFGDNNGSYWGKGTRAGNACVTNCCNICDGREYSSTLVRSSN